jgi:hypothetical protein
VGYVTPGFADVAPITAHCRSLLVAAMVPSVVVTLDEFPLMPNGKVDVKALPAPDWDTAGATDEYVAPADDLQALVQLVWMEALDKTTPISVTADYFSVGGTSLRSAVVNAGVRSALQTKHLPGEALLCICWPAALSLNNIEC